MQPIGGHRRHHGLFPAIPCYASQSGKTRHCEVTIVHGFLVRFSFSKSCHGADLLCANPPCGIVQFGPFGSRLERKCFAGYRTLNRPHLPRRIRVRNETSHEIEACSQEQS